MKVDSTVYILSFHPQLNEKEVKHFPSLDSKHSVDLYSALLLNHKEVIKSLNPIPPFFFCLDERDREFIPEEISKEKIIFYPQAENNSVPGILNEKYISTGGINIILNSNVIGIKNQDILKIFDILSVEDEVIIIGRSKKERAAFIGLNFYNPELLEGIEWDKPNFDSFLSKACMFNNKINILDDFMLINTVEDFKDLYSELSKKESMAYCGQAMHERFTNVFIEYKDLLK
ncbi:MAG TPA: hypothetical protein VMT35_16140 [Ignavibacteriaceae bacterium]|nr:hypothetical protein [Ignavibacteriaceae bacterium]